jgi:hypothetical protein
MNRDLQKITEKLRQASTRFPKWEILPAGEYSFTFSEATIKHDDDRHYDYLHVRLDCGGKLASDRFPFTDTMLFKLGEFLAAVGLDIDSLTDWKDLVGCSGTFIAEKHDDKTFYKYQEVVA